VTAKQSEPADTGRQAIGAKEVFVAEGGIFADADTSHIYAGVRKDIYGKAARFDGAAESFLEMGEKIGPHPAGLEENRESQLGEGEQNHERANPFAVSAEARHAVEVSQK